jgi:uncharacterized alpha-E superfamily protein
MLARGRDIAQVAVQRTAAKDRTYQIGTMIERADNVARMLDVKYHYLLPRLEDIGGPSDLRQWAAVLRSASALEAFRKTYGNAIRIDRVVEFLVFDPAFPHSVRFCADRIAGSIGRIAGEVPTPSLGLPTEALLRMLRTASAAGAIAEGLHNFLLVVLKEAATIANLTFSRYMSLE